MRNDDRRPRWTICATILVPGLVLLAGCGGGGGNDMPLDPDVDPITDGDWYRPEVSSTWQWQLLETVEPGYDVEIYDIDLFDSSAQLISDLQADGKKVICYFSAGSSEDWRDDFDRFEAGEMGEPLDDWEGERWLDIRSTNVHAIMLDRLDLAVEKGCDGVEPDNVDGYANVTGFPLSERDQLAFNRFVANAAHERTLTVGLKNDGGQAEDLVDYYDFELNEQCHELDECGEYAVFTDEGKPILNAEYAESLADAEILSQDYCPHALAAEIRTLILPLALDDSFRVSCDE
ncbi:MAG: endo alpha-1,4 polygalactosaminidase [Deltaproteobacteria bacterium]|nr:endo alpha-1,4 polygalactosaminidase [Deltaproteobacteria bacterium]